MAMAAETPNTKEELLPAQAGIMSFDVQADQQTFSEAQDVVQHEQPVDPLAQLPKPMRGLARFCRQFVKRLWQLAMYVAFVAPPSIVVGFLCSFLLYCIKLVTAVRNGTCDQTGFDALLDRQCEDPCPLVACDNVVGAKRWLLFFLSFSGVFVSALYTYLGNANAAGGMNTILNCIRKLEEEIDRIVDEHERREADGELTVDRVQSPEFTGLVNLRMCPLVFIGTVSTHLCGGAAGREGSALQIAASIFSKYCDLLDATLGRVHPNFILTAQMRRAALVAAVAVGFSGIFGVPVTGAIFAVEVLRVGELNFGEKLQPAVIGAFFSDWTCRLVSEKIFDFKSHSRYTCLSCQAAGEPQNWLEPTSKAGWELLAVLPAAIAFGLCGFAFEFLLHHFKHIFGDLAGKASFGNAKAKVLLTPFIGGWVIVLMWLVLCIFGTTSTFNFSSTYAGNDPKTSTFAQAYLGLSVYEPGVSITSCFYGINSTDHFPPDRTPVQPIMWYSFLIKLIFTTVTLGAGFKGGEVTPIFFIGAALGYVCGVAMGQDTQLFSAMGLLSVFAAAANTPIACTFMGIELFGGAKALPMLLANYIAYLVSNTGKVNGIYAAQDKPRGGTVTVTPFSRRAPHRV